MKTKILNIDINFGCVECPYLRQDKEKGWSIDSYYCANYTNKKGANNLGNRIDIYKNIPDWCPLPNKK